MDLQHFTNFEQTLKERQLAFIEKHGGKKIDYSYQELGVEMQKYFNKNIWYLFFKYGEKDIEKAFAICKKKDIRAVPYLIGIIKRL